MTRRHGESGFHLTQLLSGHGCFGKYLNRYGKLGSDECAQCGYPFDDAEHAVFKCDAWHHWRREVVYYLDIEELTPENLIDVMLSSVDAWRRVTGLVSRIMRMREAEERNRQRQVEEL